LLSSLQSSAVAMENAYVYQVARQYPVMGWSGRAAGPPPVY
jgi:hypothetical protein